MTDDGWTPLAGPRTSTEPMTRDEVRALFARRQEAFDNLDAAALGVHYTADCHLESPTSGRVVGRANVEKVYRAWFEGFLDLKIRTDDLLIDGNRVAQMLSVEGTDIGGFMGLPATRKSCRFDAVCLYDFFGRQIARERRIYDFTGVLVQIGILKAKPA
jgi:predicted ester cyclase